MWRDALTLLRIRTTGRDEIYASAIEDVVWSYVDAICNIDFVKDPGVKDKLLKSLSAHNGFLESMTRKYHYEDIDKRSIDKLNLCHVCYKQQENLSHQTKKISDGTTIRRSICQTCLDKEIKDKKAEDKDG